MSVTKPEDFLGKLSTAILPSGKKIFVNQIGIQRMKLVSKIPVTWTLMDRYGKLYPSVTYPGNTYTNTITNSFVSGGKVYIQFDSPSGNLTAKAELNAKNFDLSPLENLPSASDEEIEAGKKSAEANYIHELSKLSPFSPERILFSIFGMNWKQNAIITVVVGVAVWQGGKKIFK